MKIISRNLLLFLFTLLFSGLFSAVKGQYFPYKENGKWGYINKESEIILSAKYLKAEPFVKDRAIVKTNEHHFSLIDYHFTALVSGAQAIIQTEELFLVQTEGLWKVRNSEGLSINQTDYTEKPLRVDSFFVVKTLDGVGLINSEGRVLIKNKYESILFSNGLFSCLSNTGIALYSTIGTLLIPDLYDQIINIDSNYAAVQKEGKWGLYQKQKGILSHCQWDKIKKFNHRFFELEKENTNYLFDTEKRHLVSDTPYHKFIPKGENILLWNGGKIGLMSLKGKILVEAKYDDIIYLGENYYRVSSQNLWGVYKANYGLIVPVEFSKIRSFKGGYFACDNKKKMSLYNGNGVVVIPAEYELITVREDNTVQVQNDSLIGIYSLSGKKVFDTKFTCISLFENGIGKGKENNGWAVLSMNGEQSDFIYYKIMMKRDVVKAYGNNGLTMYYVDDGSLNDFENFPDMKSITVGGQYLNECTSFISRDSTVRLEREKQHLENSEWYFDKFVGKYGKRGEKSRSIVLPPQYDGYEYSSTTTTLVYKDVSPFSMKINGYKVVISRLYGLISEDADLEKLSCDYVTINLNQNINETFCSALNKKGEWLLISKNGRIMDRNVIFIGQNKEDTRRYCKDGVLEKSEKGIIANIDALLNNDVGFVFQNVAERDRFFFDKERLKIEGGYWGIVGAETNKFLAKSTYLSVSNYTGGLAALSGNNGIITVSDKNRKKVLNGYFSNIEPVKLEEDTLLVVEKRRTMYGLIDRKGNIVLEQRYDRVFLPSEDRVLFITKGEFGFSDLDGNIVIEPKFTKANPFSEELASVKTESGYGFIDKEGRTIIPFRFQMLKSFSDGLAPFLEEGKWGYINKEANVVIKAKYLKAGDFIDGLAIVETNGGKGIINNKGQWMLLPNYDGIKGPDLRGLFKIKKGESWGIFSPVLGKVIRTKHEDIKGEDGIYTVAVKNSFKVYDTFGEVYHIKRYSGLGQYKHGYMTVKRKGKWSLMNESLSPKLPFDYKKIYDWDEKRFVALKDNEIILSNLEGKIIYRTEDTFVDFLEGNTVFRNDFHEKTVINPQGEVVGKNYQDVRFISKNHALVKKEGDWLILDLINGRESENRYQQVTSNDANYCVVGRKYTQAIYAANGDELTDFKYEKMTPLSKDMIMVQVDGLVGYINRENEVVFGLRE